jgi:hypothetical protein
LIVTLGDLEIEEFAAAVQAFVDSRYRLHPVDESSVEDSADPAAALDGRGRPGKAAGPDRLTAGPNCPNFS